MFVKKLPIVYLQCCTEYVPRAPRGPRLLFLGFSKPDGNFNFIIRASTTHRARVVTLITPAPLIPHPIYRQATLHRNPLPLQQWT